MGDLREQLSRQDSIAWADAPIRPLDPADRPAFAAAAAGEGLISDADRIAALAAQDAYDQGVLEGRRLAAEEHQRASAERSWIFPIGSKCDALLPDGTHQYWSTHCRHGRHEDCSAREISGRNVQDREGWSATIERKPAQCKTCSSPCICPCHKGVEGD